jgi:hypothetical protein
MAIYRFRVLMVDKSEAVRDIEIDSKASFEVFHRAILDAFDFQGEEMASFYESDPEWNYGREIPLADMGLGEEGQKPPIIMQDMLISDCMRSTSQRFIYSYDFMSMWNFMVELVHANEPEEGVEYPRVVVRINDAPSEFSRVDGLLSAAQDENPFPSASDEKDPLDEDPDAGFGHGSIDDLGEDFI